jgi:23S rRNA (uracil1939-C5)-methyltransferase
MDYKSNPTIEEIKKDKFFMGTIEKTVFGGKGIINVEGFTVFVKNGIIGQKVVYQITKKKKNYAESIIVDIITPSSIEISKEKQLNNIPGCIYQNIEYEEQLNIKNNQLKEIFRKYEDIEIQDVLPSPKIFEYRNKMEFSIGYEKMESTIEDGEKKWNDSGVSIGFHPTGSWSKVISIDNIFIASQNINEIRRKFEKFLRDNNCFNENPWNSLINKGFWRGLIIRESNFTKDIIVNIIVTKKINQELSEKLINFFKRLNLSEKSEITGLFYTVNNTKNDSLNNPSISILYGSKIISEKLGKKVFTISPFSFFQTNTLGAEKLYFTIKSKIGNSKNKNILDLFCGTGSIGIFCSDESNSIIGIDCIKESIQLAKKNAINNNTKNTNFICDKVESVIEEVIKENKIDILIIDPPRVGIHPKALKTISELKIDKIIYISCNPTTLERDIQYLEAEGWKAKNLQALDMFPHTPHMEVIAVIENKNL